MMLFESFQSARHIGIFTHVNPDGDALGSSLGLYGFLESMGREARIFYPSVPSESLAFMIPESVKDNICVWDGNDAERMKALVKECDLLVGLDFNTLSRIREWEEPFRSSDAYKILIDHHLDPQISEFDEVYSRTETSSTCELLFNLLKDTPAISSDVSAMTELTRKSLLTGMTTDTNNFANSVFPSTLLMASELLASGTDRDSIIYELYFRYPRRRIDAEGYMISNKLETMPEGVAYVILDKDFINRFHLKEGDTEGFVNKALSMDGINYSILLKEEPGSPNVRVSIRSKKGSSARRLAMDYFHGGGHELAAGGRLKIGEDIPGIDAAENYIRNSIKKFFNEKDR